jgi:GT2 family glycosyltransferase
MSDVTVVVPTYNRGAILVSTLETLLALDPAPAEIIVVDQTAEHPPDVAATLQRWHDARRIRWIRSEVPSIPRAMNEGLRQAATPIVLFLDDDVAPVSSIVAAHEAVYDDPSVWAVVGQCLQPGQWPAHFSPPSRPHLGIPDLEMHFNHDAPFDARNAIAMNLSVRRERALGIGGFDEKFVMVAYRFESDFALRLTDAGGRIRFEPRAAVRHLRLPTGGTRAWGDHRSSAHPAHSVGDYYFALRHARSFWIYALDRLRRNVLTRYHLAHPWAIPPKLAGEIRGMLMARRLARTARTSRPSS